MRLEASDFGPCLDASGIRGFFGEGYWFHHLPVVSQTWFDFEGSTRVTKTTTLSKREGNMPLQGTDRKFGPKHLFPKCIWKSVSKQIALNSVSLSGPGLQTLLLTNLVRLGERYLISVMSVAPTKEERLQEYRQMVDLLKQWVLPANRIGLQANFTCPNTGHDPNELTREAGAILDIVAELNIFVSVKINVLVPVAIAQGIAEHPACDSLCFSNTIPFGELSDRIDWDILFPSGSPLYNRNERYGKGGLSGDPLRELVIEYGNRLRDAGVEIPFNVGGGILHPDHVEYVAERMELRPGIDSIFIGSIVMLAPWHICSVIRTAHLLLAADDEMDIAA